ncbi:MAG: Hsp20/alpha crystallin family protein [Terriglobia bacterium]
MTRLLTRWDPFRDLTTLHDPIYRLFDDSFGRFRGELGSEALEGATWAPAVDIVEKGDELVLKADLPGIDPKTVEISVENGTLTLKGERKWESDLKEDDYRRVERVYGSFVRCFTLPRSVDPDKVEAEYRNGVLQVRLPKRPEAKPKQIKVAVK